MARVLTVRPIDLGAILESQNPSIDLRLKEIEVASRTFLKAVSAYSGRAIEEITQRKARHAQELKRAAEKKQVLEADITACKVKEIKLVEGASGVVTCQRDAASLNTNDA